MKSKSFKKTSVVTIGTYKTVKRKKIQITHIITSIDGGDDVAFGYLYKGKKVVPMLWKMNGKHMINKKYNIKKKCE